MSFYTRRGKRIADLVVASCALVFLAPLHAGCAIAVFLSSGGPVYFSQQRIGHGGRPFLLRKFRTMAVGTHEISQGYPDASMVTPIGRLLRVTSLDELPQLANILVGEMSFVGPRPALPEQVARYSEHQRRRLTVRPGLTGLAQVRYRNNAPWSVRIESDIEYAESVGPLRDLAVILRTVPAVLFGVGVAVGQSMEQVDDLGPAQGPPR